jgi:hypothetical protein
LVELLEEAGDERRPTLPAAAGEEEVVVEAWSKYRQSQI